MRAEGLVFASDALIGPLRQDPCVQQVANVAHLPGLVGPAMAMPDIHLGYGFPIGGVAAFDAAEGVVSPGGVGFDIACGVRLLATGLPADDLRPRVAPLMDSLQAHIPAGLGRGRHDLVLRPAQLRRVLARGARWVLEQGMGSPADLEHTESGGQLPEAEPAAVSDSALARGRQQLGTLGSGNHFCEVGWVDEVFDSAAAQQLGLAEGQATVLLHTGSRGLGYAVCQDHIKAVSRAARAAGLRVPDRQLACAPVRSAAGRAYLGAMYAAANFAYANRQALTHFVRVAFERGLRMGPADHRLRVVWDVAHNLARVETHAVEGRRRKLCVHRKGATRALPPGHPELPAHYRSLGQPVLIPGDMGSCSYVALGTAGAARETWASVCHGAGRRLSRKQAVKRGRGRNIRRELEQSGVAVRVQGRETLAEEMPDAYKDVTEVVHAVQGAGLARLVARLRPLGVLKG